MDKKVNERNLIVLVLDEAQETVLVSEDGISDYNHETFLWEGLALLRRGDTAYITEPHANGGTVIQVPVGHSV